MERSALLPWHSKGLLKDRFLSMDFTRICGDDERRASKTLSRGQNCHVIASFWFSLSSRFADARPEARQTEMGSHLTGGGGAGTHHGGEAGDELDAVLHLLLGDLHSHAVLFLQRERVCAVLSHPRVQLHPQKHCHLTAPTPTGLRHTQMKPP